MRVFAGIDRAFIQKDLMRHYIRKINILFDYLKRRGRDQCIWYSELTQIKIRWPDVVGKLEAYCQNDWKKWFLLPGTAVRSDRKRPGNNDWLSGGNSPSKTTKRKRKNQKKLDMKQIKFPVLDVVMVPVERVVANDYNP